jgi:hypothetical protein
MTSHILRQKILQELYDQFIHLVNEGCYPLILDIFSEYRKWIKHQADINYELQRIRLSYEEQCKNTIPINELRQIISNELQKMHTIHNSLLSDQPSMIRSENNSQIYQDQQITNINVDENFSYSSNIIINDLSARMQKTMKQAENNMKMLNDAIKQLHRNIESQTQN